MAQSSKKAIISLFEGKSGTILQDDNILIQDIELDSIQFIELLVEIEQMYSIEFESDKLVASAFERLADLIDYVNIKVNRQMDKGSY